MSDWVICSKGHEHFGRFGAAGILIYRFRPSGEVEMLIGQRAGKGDWSTIGGFLDEGEIAENGALRELREEIGLDARDLVEYTGFAINDHGGWKYTTIVATLKGPPLDMTKLRLQKSEITAVAWVTRRDLDMRRYVLHPGFAETARVLEYLLPPNIDPKTGKVTEEFQKLLENW
ncbi:hypothetical protein F5Y06DRAFT_306873 [Hypoxylon sp. FL0890]|nr:hypothetical protein F5Y06DRAFT_306873 [Hypoxylon sp. FL0890]